ncbi:MAG: putative toxin-antitoxin system toxin component, PIN family [Scytonema sp. PMC 1069.18]|nr:putative toxin-antitoxin system toxin component, PIN family [Scytonema sp. PMC 1069.18]MEC4885868.1 putative toxin-antitoxin system toxin component, PIN family [Scytonema sp. PMC 1070.18]
MLRVVFDTNVLVSRLLAAKESPPAQAVRLVMEGTAVHLFSEATFQELGDVLSRPKFDSYLSREKRLHFLFEMRELSEFVTINRTFSICRDPRDNKFLDLAVCGNADYLITGDEDLLELHPFEGVSILSPASFLARG